MCVQQLHLKNPSNNNLLKRFFVENLLEIYYYLKITYRWIAQCKALCASIIQNENNSKFSALKHAIVHRFHTHTLNYFAQFKSFVNPQWKQNKLFHQFIAFSCLFFFFSEFSLYKWYLHVNKQANIQLQNINTLCEKRMVCHKYRWKFNWKIMKQFTHTWFLMKIIWK